MCSDFTRWWVFGWSGNFSALISDDPLRIGITASGKTNQMNEVILLDIEGTTTPVDFVYKTLFPYARERLRNFIDENRGSLTTEVHLLTGECDDDGSFEGEITNTESIAVYLEFLMDSDRKSTPLKSIQGRIWKSGYEDGTLVAEVFPDVAPAFVRWRAESRKIAIYSSGSVLAQKLLFGHTQEGDLTKYIDAFFDTGHKAVAKSYENIAAELGVAENEILFVSDSVAELDAARQAGCKTLLAVRPGNARVAVTHKHDMINSFDEIE